jgi:thermostable 8-oxoguanine DNA glycosylase
MNVIETIDPKTITNYQRDEANLQAFWTFCIITAGKNADVQSRKVAGFLSKNRGLTPFQYYKFLGPYGLREKLKEARTGQYERIAQALLESVEFDLTKVTVDELESIYGVGPKTARFFILHTRPNVHLAVLDTHILKFLRTRQVVNVPRSTPSDRNQYNRLERAWLYHYPLAYPHCTPAQADLLAWKEMSGRNEILPAL